MILQFFRSADKQSGQLWVLQSDFTNKQGCLIHDEEKGSGSEWWQKKMHQDKSHPGTPLCFFDKNPHFLKQHI